MYRALWRVLPGPTWLKIIELAIGATALLALLFYVVFPFIAQTFLLEQSTVGGQ